MTNAVIYVKYSTELFFYTWETKDPVLSVSQSGSNAAPHELYLWICSEFVSLLYIWEHNMHRNISYTWKETL